MRTYYRLQILSTLSHNYSHFCLYVSRTWAVLILRGWSNNVKRTTFNAESDGRINCISISIVPQFDSFINILRPSEINVAHYFWCVGKISCQWHKQCKIFVDVKHTSTVKMVNVRDDPPFSDQGCPISTRPERPDLNDMVVRMIHNIELALWDARGGEVVLLELKQAVKEL